MVDYAIIRKNCVDALLFAWLHKSDFYLKSVLFNEKS